MLKESRDLFSLIRGQRFVKWKDLTIQVNLSRVFWCEVKGLQHLTNLARAQDEQSPVISSTRISMQISSIQTLEKLCLKLLCGRRE